MTKRSRHKTNSRLFAIVLSMLLNTATIEAADHITMEDEVYRINTETDMYEVDRELLKENITDSKLEETEVMIDLVYVEDGNEIIRFNTKGSKYIDSFTILRTLTFRQWYDVKKKKQEEIKLYVNLYDTDSDSEVDAVNFELEESTEGNHTTEFIIITVNIALIALILIRFMRITKKMEYRTEDEALNDGSSTE